MKHFSALTIGTMIVSPILGGLAIGYLLDEKFGTKPLWIVVGLLLGTVDAFWYLYRLVKTNA